MLHTKSSPVNLKFISMTLEQAQKWKKATLLTILNLNCATGACTIVVGESLEKCIFVDRDARLKHFKSQLVQREIIDKAYRIFGNRRPAFSLDNVTGRNTFYNLKDFLLKEKVLLQKFLSESLNTALTITEVLMLVDPTGTLKTANSSLAVHHDVTHKNLLDVLGIFKGLDVGEGEKWAVTGQKYISKFKGDCRLVKSTCKDLKDRLANRQSRCFIQRAKFFKKLEREGIVVSRDSFESMNIILVIEVVLVILVAVLLIPISLNVFFHIPKPH